MPFYSSTASFEYVHGVVCRMKHSTQLIILAEDVHMNFIRQIRSVE